jgi:hypothetical protein
MRLLLLTLAILAGAIGLAPQAHAQNYPWCAHLDVGSDDAVNCGFVSFEQCMTTVRGMGGFCMANNTYVSPAPRPAQKMKKHLAHNSS